MLSVHRLVQAVTRTKLPAPDQPRWATAAADLLDNALPAPGYETWPIYDRLLPHARAAIDRAEGLDVASGARARLLNEVGCYLKGRARFAEARAFLSRAAELAELVYGPDHPTVAIVLGNLATVLKDLGDPGAARPLAQRALAIGEAAHGPDHPTVATRLNNLATVLKDLGDPGAASLLERARRIREGGDAPSAS